MKNLLAWFEKTNRKPLVLRGARQVGKTWVVRELAKNLSVDLIELNFEREPELSEIFEEKSPEKILGSIEKVKGKRIIKENSLLFLDEIQKAPQAFANLRWFYEECPQLAVISTGSLLDFVLKDHQFSMPVGRISYMFMEPMSFSEFLLANGEEPLFSFIKEVSVTTKFPNVIHEKLSSLFNSYLTIGGMPAVVKEWIDTTSPAAVAEYQQDILNTFADDFSKYAGRISPDRIRKVMLSVPRLLGRKYKYSLVDREEKSQALRKALDLLCLARVCHKVRSSNGRGIPLAAEENDRIFKVVFLDTGLASAVQGIVLKSEKELNEFIRINKGGIAEQAVGQMLRAGELKYIDPTLHYYVREKSGSEAEIDYLFQLNAQITPIEVKAGATGSLKSLHQFMASRGFELAVRVNIQKPSIVEVDVKTTKGIRAQYTLISVPFYLVGELRRIIEENS